MADNKKWKYYSVKNPVKINGRKKIPSVCYPIAHQDLPSMESLAAQGTVILYENKVRFVSGKPIEVARTFGVRRTTIDRDSEFLGVDTTEFDGGK